MTTKCQLCGEPMPEGEEMFNYHGYSGPCPKPPLAPASSVPAGEATRLPTRSEVEAAIGALKSAAYLDGDASLSGDSKSTREAEAALLALIPTTETRDNG